LNGNTKIVGIIGNPISHTASPAMHNAGFKKLGLNFIYVPLHVKPDQLETAVQAIRAYNFAGINVTVPYKEAVIPFLDKIDKKAESIGAVNTIVNRDGKLIGYNTDGEGFLQSFKHESGKSAKGKSVCILGAGGSAKAIAFGLLAEAPRKMVILNRTQEKADSLASRLKSNNNLEISTPAWETRSKWAEKADIIINTTSLGLQPNPRETPLESHTSLTNRQICYDVIYNPSETRFLADAKKSGAKTINGAGMLAYQGLLAFQLWTGKTVDFEIFRKEIR